MQFERDGALLVGNGASLSLPALDTALAPFTAALGYRLRQLAALQPVLATTGDIGRHVAAILGHKARPVRTLLLDKSVASNWALTWHQDRTIVVKERREVPGFGPWTIKQGMHHVAPPPEVLARMVTARIHLDAVAVDNAPLLIAPGSHRLGRIAEADVPAVVARCGQRTCVAAAGDVWLYATPILHASDAAAKPRRRRVLQVDYAAEELPGGLAWLGLD